MTKKLKKSLILIFSALLALTALFFIMPEKALAESGNYFKTAPGVSIKYYFKESRNVDGGVKEVYPMKFFFKPTEDYAHFIDIKNFSGGILDKTGGKIDYKNTFQTFDFTLRHKNGETNAGNASEKLITLRVVFGFYDDGSVAYATSYYKHDVGFSEEKIEFPKYSGNNSSIPAVVKEFALKGGFTLGPNYGGSTQNGFTIEENGYFPFTVYLDSYNEEFDVLFDFYGKRASKHGFLNWAYTEEEFDAVAVESASRSIKKWLELSYEAGTLQYEVAPTLYEEALRIVTGVEFKDVTISYLVPLRDTPFAIRETLRVESVPVIGTQVKVDDLRLLTGLNFNIFDTTVYSFEYVEESDFTYEPYYLKDAKITAKTKEGKTLTFYCSLNTSYADAFIASVNEGLITQAEYEYALSRVYALYPSILGAGGEKLIYEKDLYGRFGLISLPENNVSLEGFFANVFGGEEYEATKLNVLDEYQGVLTRTQYSSLLENYNYSQYQVIFEDLFAQLSGDSLDATHYLFFAKPGEADVKQEDPVTPGIKDGVGGIVGGLSDFFGNLGSDFGAFLGSKGGTTTIVVIAVVSVGVYLAFRTGAFKGLFKGAGSGRTSQRKRRKK